MTLGFMPLDYFGITLLTMVKSSYVDLHFFKYCIFDEFVRADLITSTDRALKAFIKLVIFGNIYNLFANPGIEELVDHAFSTILKSGALELKNRLLAIR